MPHFNPGLKIPQGFLGSPGQCRVLLPRPPSHESPGFWISKGTVGGGGMQLETDQLRMVTGLKPPWDLFHYLWN